MLIIKFRGKYYSIYYLENGSACIVGKYPNYIFERSPQDYHIRLLGWFFIGV